MKKKNTIIYGGAFNPPTIAHEIILQSCVDYAAQQHADVWVMPSGDRYDKSISVCREQRIEFINLMIRDTKVPEGVAVDVMTLELDRDHIVRTVDTVKELAKLYPDRSFIWVFGSDVTRAMIDWRGGGWLLKNLRMLVVERPGSTTNPLAKHVAKLDSPNSTISSSEVRRRLAVGESIDGLVSPAICHVINKNTSPV